MSIGVETIKWLIWLIQSQNVSLGSPDAQTHVAAATEALEWLTKKLERAQH